MFSIIIPVYNKANTICRTLDSILCQSFNDYEIIIIDDGSTDDLEQALDKYKFQIRLIKQENQGVSAARNRGISESSGEFVCFLDADDEWLPMHLELLTNAIKMYPEEVFFSTLFKQINPDQTVKSKLACLKDYSEISIIEDYFKMMLDYSHVFINTDTVCIAREVLLRENFVIGEAKGEDTDLWYRLAAYYNLVLIKRETALYHQEDSTATRDGFNPVEWFFAKRENELLSNNDIPINKRKHIAELLERWRCACFRDAILKGNSKDAKKWIKNMRYPFYLRSLFCRIMYYLPICLSKKIISWL